MRKISRALIFGAALLACNACVPLVPNFSFSRHDPDQAAVGAIIFAKEAFIDLNQPEAYGFLSEEVRQKTSYDQYIDLIARMHPEGFPKEVRATGYEPIPGGEAMFIWLYGEGDGEQFHYRVTMRGKAPAGYEVAEVIRAARTPPQSSVAPLPLKRSTAGLL
jgi:hypothetical protein